MAQRVFTQTFGTTGAIIEKGGKILLVKQAASKKSDAGKWDFPAGWIDVGENPLDAAKREVEEETGHKFVPTYILGVYSLLRKDFIKVDGQLRHNIQIVYLGELSDEKTRELEDDVLETKWFAPEEIYNMGLNLLRQLDIKTMVKDYFAGKKYPLELLIHTTQE